MINTYLNITTLSEWITFFAATILLDKRTGWWRLFIAFMGLTILVEATGWYMGYILRIQHNSLPFNVLMLVTIPFFIWFFARQPQLYRIKKLLYYIIGAFLLFGLINFFFFEGFNDYNTISEAVGDITLSLICCYFLFTLFKGDEYMDLLPLPSFWVSTGILFFCLGSAMLYLFGSLLNTYQKNTGIYIGNYINFGLNVILYGSLIIAFICQRKITRSL